MKAGWSLRHTVGPFIIRYDVKVSVQSPVISKFYFKCSSESRGHVANAHMLLNVGLLPNCLDESVIQICIDIYSRNVNGRWGAKRLIVTFAFSTFCCHCDPMIYHQPAAGRELSFLFGNYKEPQNNWTCGLNIYDGNNGWEIIYTHITKSWLILPS